MRTRNRLLLFLLVLVGALGEVWRTTSFDDLELGGHPWRDPDALFRVASRTRDVVVELLIRAQGRSPVAYLVLVIFVAASFVLRARAHHVATAVPLPWRGAGRRARLVWGGALLVAAIPQVPVVPAFALCAVAIELGFRLRFRDLLGALRRGRAPGFELEPASGEASSSVPIQRAWGRGGAEVLMHRRDASPASYRTAHAQELLRVEYRRPALLRGCALLAVLGAAWLLVVAGPAEATSVEPLPSSRGRSVVAATAQPAEVPSTRSPQDPRRESFSLGECLDEGALRDVPEVSPAPETARDGAFYVRWIARAEPGPPAPEDDDPRPKRKLHPIWDT
ncbi:MAG: hypothetical protein HOO96_04170, partial [Polyangiaceae bacterium]|nr:hypothetical protein [Polyangiaceae bacterium]